MSNSSQIYLAIIDTMSSTISISILILPMNISLALESSTNCTITTTEERGLVLKNLLQYYELEMIECLELKDYCMLALIKNCFNRR